ncbi:MAG TPA: imidazolonepropionase [Pyrinomonadaceae bacterium]|nr:imidazolonepropionase [Pyrinomonadaceae bacterium]
MPQHVDLIIHNAGELVTCAAGGKPKRGQAMRDAGVIGEGAVAASKGKIAAVGSSDNILHEFSADEVLDAEGRVVCPGLVDPHTHIVYGGDRLAEFELKIKGADYLEIMAAGGGILSTVWHTRNSSVDQLVSESTKRLDKMLACGTTTCEIKSGYGLDTETELKMLAVIAELDKRHPIDVVPTFLAAHTIPTEYKGNTQGYVDLVCGEMLPRAWDWYSASHFATQNTPFFADVFCEKNAFGLEETGRILETAKALWFGVKAHVDQFTNLGGSNLAIEIGAISIDHLDSISDDEIRQLAASETIGVVIPTESFNAGKTKFAPARRMIDAGCAVALTTDYNPGSAPCPSLPMAMAISTRYQNLLPAEALCAATINAAYSIGLGTTHGSLEVGKVADLLILDTDDHRQLAHEFGGNLVTKVLKNAAVVYEHR